MYASRHVDSRGHRPGRLEMNDGSAKLIKSQRGTYAPRNDSFYIFDDDSLMFLTNSTVFGLSYKSIAKLIVLKD